LAVYFQIAEGRVDTDDRYVDHVRTPQLLRCARQFSRLRRAVRGNSGIWLASVPQPAGQLPAQLEIVAPLSRIHGPAGRSGVMNAARRKPTG
jgi:hypothetical protein